MRPKKVLTSSRSRLKLPQALTMMIIRRLSDSYKLELSLSKANWHTWLRDCKTRSIEPVKICRDKFKSLLQRLSKRKSLQDSKLMPKRKSKHCYFEKRWKSANRLDLKSKWSKRRSSANWVKLCRRSSVYKLRCKWCERSAWQLKKEKDRMPW